MYTQELEECQRRIALGASLNTLLNHNPDFQVVFVQGLLHDEVLLQSLRINKNENDTVEFLKAVAALRKYLDKVLVEAEQAQADFANYMNLIKDGR